MANQYFFHSSALAKLWQVEQFDKVAEFVQPDALKSMVHISADLDQHIGWIRKDTKLGFKRIFHYAVNREQELYRCNAVEPNEIQHYTFFSRRKSSRIVSRTFTASLFSNVKEAGGCDW